MAPRRDNNNSNGRQSTLSSTFTANRKPRVSPNHKLKTESARTRAKRTSSPDVAAENPAYEKLLIKLLAGDLSPRFHQEEMSIGDKLLRQFDLNPAYGPAMGLTRLQRWDRAEAMGKRPPPEIKQYLLECPGDEQKWSVLGQLG